MISVSPCRLQPCQPIARDAYRCKALDSRWLHLFQDFRCVIGCFSLSLTVTTSQTVSRAADATVSLVQNISINHWCPNATVTKEFLNRADVVARLAMSGALKHQVLLAQDESSFGFRTMSRPPYALS